MAPQFRRVLQSSILLLAAGSLSAQSKRPEDLAVGKVLITTRDTVDPLFAESVVLLVRYSENGALGLMVNRRTTVPISRALHELKGADARSDPVFLGGPVQLDTVFGLAHAAHKPEGASDVVGEIYLVSEKAALEKALSAGSGDLRIYLGYCGWSPGQLENEMRHGGWYVFDGSERVAFDAEPATLWSRLIAKAEAHIASDDSLHPDLMPRDDPGELRSPPH